MEVKKCNYKQAKVTLTMFSGPGFVDLHNNMGVALSQARKECFVRVFGDCHGGHALCNMPEGL